MSVNDRLYRSADDRVLAGVCAGIADRLDMDPAVVRIGYAVLALLTGVFPLLVLYVIMVVVIPEEPTWAGVRPVDPSGPVPGWPAGGATPAGAPGDSASPTAAPGGETAAAAGAVPTGGPAPTGGAAPTGGGPASPGPMPGWIPPGTPGSWDRWSWRDQRRAERAARHADRAARRAEHRGDPLPGIIFGLFLVGLGAVFLLGRTFDIDWSVVWPVALLALGVVVLVAAIRPRSG
jgi:phage shock protein C